MPAGDLVTLNWHLEIRALLHGPGTLYMVDRERGAYKGLGTPAPKANTVPLDQADGAYGAPEYSGTRIITAAFMIKASTPAAAMNALAAANTAWASSTSDIPLYLKLAGWGKFHVNGRPRGLDEDISRAELGIIPILCSFEALTPTIVTP